MPAAAPEPDYEDSEMSSDHPMRRASDRRTLRFDGTVNIPTILGLAGVVWAGFTVYSDMDRRVSKNTHDVATLQARQAEFSRDLLSARSEQSAQVQTLKVELRADLTEIKGTLNSMLIANLKEQPRP